jgi:dTDP-L-rhamnose 4-epimerase
MSRRILVTGGAGFVGTHLVEHLVRRGDEVVVLDSLEAQVHLGTEQRFPDGVSFIHGDVGDPVAATRALEDVEAVVHLAAGVGVGQSMYEIERYVRINTHATAGFLERLVTRSPRPNRLVVTSSMSIYGEGEHRCPEHGSVAPGLRPEEQLIARRWECVCPTCGAELTPLPTSESKPLIPTSVYAITKRDHEELCQVVGHAYGVATVALRCFNVYGPGQALSNPYTGVAAIFSSRLLNDRAPLVFEDGLQSRDFVHVSDIVRAIELALESDDAVGHAINVGTGRSVSIGKVAELIDAGLHKRIAAEYPGTFRMGDIRHCFADPARAEKLLGFRATVELEAGIVDLMDWVSTQTATDSVDEAAAELVARQLVR